MISKKEYFQHILTFIENLRDDVINEEDKHALIECLYLVAFGA